MGKINLKRQRKPKIKTYNKRTAQDIYDSVAWRKLRAYKIMMNPLCEICEEKGKTTMATEVHHIIPFMNGIDKYQRQRLALDYSNIMSICGPCHQDIHKKNYCLSK